MSKHGVLKMFAWIKSFRFPKSQRVSSKQIDAIQKLKEDKNISLDDFRKQLLMILGIGA